jgi:hypothetical protein
MQWLGELTNRGSPRALCRRSNEILHRVARRQGMMIVSATEEKIMRKIRVALVTFAAAGALLAQFNPPKTHLKVGDEAPDFTLPSTGGQPVKLSDFRGKKTVVLAFFPAAFTGG